MAKSQSKRNEVVNQIRREIVGGGLEAGSRLPTYVELQKRFRTTSSTIRMAMERLCRDGFVVSRAPQGMYVSQTPPHTCRIGVLIPSWHAISRFVGVIARVAATGVDSQHEMVVFSGAEEGPIGETGDFGRLVEELNAHRIAGLILASPKNSLIQREIVEKYDVPCIQISYPQDRMHTIYPDIPGFYTRAIDHLTARGRTRLALASMFNLEWPDFARDHLRKVGAITRPEWVQTAGPQTAGAIRNSIHLLCSGASEDRPDGLIISDDNLIPHATAGILAAGAQVPYDLEVVVACNYPMPAPTMVPVTAIGFDVAELVRRCARTIDLIREGADAPKHDILPAVQRDSGSGSWMAPEEYAGSISARYNSVMTTAFQRS